MLIDDKYGAKDIVPALLDAIKKDFAESISSNPAMIRFAELLKNGTATYKQANDYATWCGQLLSASFKKHITPETLPHGRMYYNIAERILNETLKQDHELIATAAEAVQNSLNENAGIGIKAIKPKVNQSRIDNLIDKVSNAESFDDVAWVLDEPVVNFSQSVVDAAIKLNVDFQGKAGLPAKVVRTATSGACEWCQEVAGEFTYPDVPEDTWRRHTKCGCIIDYTPQKGKTKRYSGTGKSWR